MTTSPYSKENLSVGIKHFLLGRGLAGLAGFATVVLLVRFMSVEHYAGYTALTGVIVLAGIIAGLGFERAISRYVPEGRLERGASELGRFIWTMAFMRLAASILMCLVLYVSWDWVLAIFQDVTIKKFPLALACFVLAETLFQYFSSVLQALVLQKTLTQLMIIQWAGRLLLILLFVWQQTEINLEDSLWIMAIPEMLGVIGFVVVLLHYINKLSHAQSKKIFNQHEATWPDWQGVTQLSLHNYGFTLLAAPPQGYFMKMLAAALLPTQMVAAYGFFLSVAERLRQYIPLHLLYNLIEPVMIASYLQDKNFKTLSYRSQLLYKSNLLLMVPVIAWIVVAGPQIIGLLTGGKFQEFTWILLVVFVQLTVGSHVVLLQLILNSVNASVVLVRAGFWALIVMAISTVLACLVDMRALILGPTAFSLACNLYVLHQFKKMRLDYAFSWHMLLGVAGAGAIAAILSYWSLNFAHIDTLQPIWLALVTGLIVVIAYALSLPILKAINMSELHLLKSFFIRKPAMLNPVLGHE
ncbi:MAG: oligosaccharide flippase family protein [Methylophilaceae bacterium]|nr:oligosaccharide flippase family protein [Methylophilaceae bacterium]